ncbi:MAG: putative porin [Kiritimatiellae bacterium]|nr:putative porin [Kiritimatiellia bacterium]MCO5061693.1 putative porin [Kiritimatiellia bacterium]MCO6401229.1 putative porin [Verrucomicrobiota bacterium]
MNDKLKNATLAALALASLTLAQTGFAESAKPNPSWTDEVKIKGDARFRYETINEDGKDSRNRARIRARIGAFVSPTEELDLGVQFSTSENNDPVSSNQTLGDGGSRKEAYFDLAYLDFHPDALPGLRAVLGKMKLPFVQPSDLIFDGDYHPEGAAVNYTWGKDVQVLLNGANVWIEERSSADETTMAGIQAAIRFQSEDRSFLQAGIARYQYQNMEGFAPVFDEAKGAKGNSMRKVTSGNSTSLVYATDFAISEIFVDAWKNASIPYGVYAQYAFNDEADADNTAYLVGLKIGKAKDPGSFDFNYNWRHVEKDSVVGQLTDSDSFGGGTDGEGHRFSLGYQVAKNLKATVTYFLNTQHISGDESDYNRLQVDFAATF